MAEPAKQTHSVLKHLKILSSSPKPPSYDCYTAVRGFLFDVFDAYRRTDRPIATAEREEVEGLLIKSIPEIDKGLREIRLALNADKRVEGQESLSALQFLTDDFDKEELKKLMESDLVEDLKEIVEYSKDGDCYGPAETPDLTNVPESHVWWQDD